MLPIDEVKKGVKAVAQALNVLSKLVHKQGLLVLLELVPVIDVFKNINYKAFASQVLDMSGPEGDEVKALFKQELVLQNKGNEVKLESAVDIVQDVVALAGQGVGMYNKGKAIVERVKALLA